MGPQDGLGGATAAGLAAVGRAGYGPPAPDLGALRARLARADRAIRAYDRQATFGVDRPADVDRPLEFYRDAKRQAERAIALAQGTPAPSILLRPPGLHAGPTPKGRVRDVGLPPASRLPGDPGGVTSTQIGTQVRAAMGGRPPVPPPDGDYGDYANALENGGGHLQRRRAHLRAEEERQRAQANAPAPTPGTACRSSGGPWRTRATTASRRCR